ncbi:MAG: ferredoxin [Candidatus Aenigmarchaeota archaeon]|nr:ferredoxin [Candidatus Aenigmarchaeota archaeon]
MAYKIEHDRPSCIACAACSIVAPEFWQMSPCDGKSDLANSEHVVVNSEIVKEELQIEAKDFVKNKNAADMCPVNVIHIVRRDGEKII